MTVAVDIQCNVLESEGFEDPRKARCHTWIHRSRQFVTAKLEPCEFAVVANAIDTEAEFAQGLFALLDLLDPFGGDRDAVLNAGTEAGCRWPVPGWQSSEAREFADVCFCQARFEKWRINAVFMGGSVAGTIVLSVVEVDAVDDVVESEAGAGFGESAEEFVFAVETAIAVVADVVGVVELFGFDEFVPNSELPDEILSVTFVGSRN